MQVRCIQALHLLVSKVTIKASRKFKPLKLIHDATMACFKSTHKPATHSESFPAAEVMKFSNAA